MQVTAIRGSEYKANNFNFKGRENNQQSQENSGSKVEKAPKYVTIPTALFIALATTALSNGSKAETLSEENISPKIEVLKQTNDNPLFYNPGSIKYSKEFKMDGKNYTMVYIDEFFRDRDPSKKVITKIAFVPNGFKKQIPGTNETREPMVLRKLIYHDLGQEKEFLGAYVTEKSGTLKECTIKAKEIRLPNNIAEELIALIDRKTEFKYINDDNYTETKSAELMPPEKY